MKPLNNERRVKLMSSATIVAAPERKIGFFHELSREGPRCGGEVGDPSGDCKSMGWRVANKTKLRADEVRCEHPGSWMGLGDLKIGFIGRNRGSYR